MGENSPVHMNPSYLWAQQMATQRMVLALARGLGVEPDWRQQSTAQILQLRDLMLNTQAPDDAIAALDDALAYLASGKDPHG